MQGSSFNGHETPPHNLGVTPITDKLGEPRMRCMTMFVVEKETGGGNTVRSVGFLKLRPPRQMT